MKTFVRNTKEWLPDSQEQSVELTVTAGGGCGNHHKRCEFRRQIHWK